MILSKLDFETAVQQEMAYLKKIHPMSEDIPSCMKLFDMFLSCNGKSRLLPFSYPLLLTHLTGVNSQVKSLYRYGHMAECDRKFADVKFCMSNKSMHPEEKYEVWIRRRAEWWATRRMSKSSEDVWRIRTYVAILVCCYELHADE